jgi:hypothetical protein
VDGHRVEHGAGPAEERLSLAPVRTQVLQVLRRHAAAVRRVLLVQAEAVMAPGELAQLGAEDDVLAGAGRM